MEPPSEVAVSLDELTLDLSGDVMLDNNECDVTSVEKEKGSASPPLKEGDTPFVNLSFILQDKHQEYQSFGTDEKKEKYDDTPDLLNELKYEINETDDKEELGKEVFKINPSLKPSTGPEEILEPTEPEDFEVDVPPLSLFSSQRDDDSDDSEFEVPEPNHTTKPQVLFDVTHKDDDSNDVQTNSQKDYQGLGTQGKFQISEKKEVSNVMQINSALPNEFEPEILTQREKLSSDLPTALLLKDTLENEKNDWSAEETSYGCQKSSTHPSSIKETEIKVTEVEDSDKGYTRPSIVTTAEDWEGVQTVEPGFADSSQQGSVPVIESKPLATYSASWNEMADMDYSGVKSNIKSHIERRGLSAIAHMLFGPPKLHKDLLSERELVFCIAGTAFENEKEVHNRILQTVYRCLTGSKFDCQRYGGHWEEIGFQGRDPATDLRGTGMLALLHILYFLTDPRTKSLARDVYKLSLHPTQHFPFCIMSINVTRICLQVFREDVYNKECNKRKEVMVIMNQVYAALYLQLYLLWKKGKTIADSGHVLQDVETYSRKHSKDVFKDLESYEKKGKQEALFGEHPESNPSFLDVCKEDKCDNKTTAELY